MTRATSLIALVVVAPLLFAPSNDARAETPPVVRVLVHPDAAIVTRAASATCANGPTTVAFHGLPAALDPSSLRASVLGSSSEVEGVSIAERDLQQSASPEVADLDSQIEALQTKRQALERQIARASQTKARATALRDSSSAFIAREQVVSKKPDIKAWQSALEQSLDAITEADKTVRETRIAERELDKTIADLQRRRGKLSGAGSTKSWDADVVVQCEGRATVELSYLTTVARWTPAYEARADEGKKLVKLSVLASVEQGTGEDWSDVDVTLSTALAKRDSRPPKPTRLYVSTYEHKEEKKVLVMRQEQANHAEGGMQGGLTGGAQAVDQGVSVQLHVPEKSTVPGDGEASRLVIDTLPLEATFDLVTFPKVLPAVFHRATMIDTAGYPLLAGPLDLFDVHGFLGTTRLERKSRGEKVELAFGLDENVQVHRVVLEEEKKDPGFFTGNRKLLYGYRFELASSAKKPLVVQVTDNVPVSELEDLKVDIQENTTPGYELQKDDGLVTWKVSLAPGEKKNVELHFTVEIPGKYDAAGL